MSQEGLILETLLEMKETQGKIHTDVKNLKENQNKSEEKLDHVLSEVDLKIRLHKEECKVKKTYKGKTNWKKVMINLGFFVGTVIITVIGTYKIK